MVPAVSIIIPCRNEARHIQTCLDNVLAFEPPPGGFEVIVADGMSDDGTREIIGRIAEKDSRLRLVDNPARITPSALNACIRAARGEVIVRIDAHTEYAPDYLRCCAEVLSETGASNVGGPWTARGNTYLQSCIAAAFNSPLTMGGARGHQVDYSGPVDTVYLGCWPRKVLEEIGFFDDEFVRNQDDELNLRLLRGGGSIWQSSRIRSWYAPRGSLTALFRQYFQYGYWKVRVIQKHHRPASLRHLIPGAFAAALLLLGPAAFFSAAAQVALAILAGTYVVALAAASILVAVRTRWEYVPVLPLVIACFHLGYGFGFLFGVWNFVVFRRGNQHCTELTR